LGGALFVTIVVGAAAVGVLPQVRPLEAPSASAADTTLERASLSSLAKPVSVVIAEKEDLAAESSEELRLEAQKAVDALESTELPSDSGKGRRIVFSESGQRVWLVGRNGRVDRTYLVSGSKFDNLNPGTYTVQSKSRNATAFDYSGRMEYFVRFTSGFTAPIGFHTVPVDNAGRLEQSKEQLGTPRSAGCIRQWRDDAMALWEFAPIGTKVVVTS
jgi:lipoprotein-anchoring transpeptidase ErfK/SrfK